VEKTATNRRLPEVSVGPAQGQRAGACLGQGSRAAQHVVERCSHVVGDANGVSEADAVADIDGAAKDEGTGAGGAAQSHNAVVEVDRIAKGRGDAGLESAAGERQGGAGGDGRAAG